MSYVDNAISIALFLLIFSSALTLLNSPLIGIGQELGYKKDIKTGTNKEELEKKVKKKRNLTPIPGLDYLYQAMAAGFEIFKVVIGIPFAIYNVCVNLIPGALGQVIGVALQTPANLIMAAGLAMYFKR